MNETGSISILKCDVKEIEVEDNHEFTLIRLTNGSAIVVDKSQTIFISPIKVLIEDSME